MPASGCRRPGGRRCGAWPRGSRRGKAPPPRPRASGRPRASAGRGGGRGRWGCRGGGWALGRARLGEGYIELLEQAVERAVEDEEQKLVLAADVVVQAGERQPRGPGD